MSAKQFSMSVRYNLKEKSLQLKYLNQKHVKNVISISLL